MHSLPHLLVRTPSIMESLLQAYEEQQYQCRGFWVTAVQSLPTQPTVHRGVLRVKSSAGRMKRRECWLTQEFLYAVGVSSRQKNQKKKATPVRWKRVEPFSEENGAEKRYGFRLVRGSNYQDFYVSTEPELERWLDHLSEVAIMTDLDNDYRRLQELGRGSYAQVFKGRNNFTRGLVAIKVIHKAELATDEKSAHTLFNEVNVMKKLDHRRIIRLLGMYENEENLYLVIEYAGGGDLFQRLMTVGKYSEAQTMVFMRGLLEALDHMHSRGVVHRDIKPENILLVGSELTDFKIADFGLAADISSGDDLQLRCGSPGYVAPEVLGRSSYGSKADVFSAGIVMYILSVSCRLSGRSPFASPTEDLNDVLIRNRSCKIFFLQKYWMGVSESAISLVLTLTTKDPFLRPTAREALSHPWFSSDPSSLMPIAISTSLPPK